MNERINDLVGQAKFMAEETINRKISSNLELNTFAEKFAELIVRECARLAIEKQTENDILNIVSKNPAKDFAYALIEHFGVEE